jgi:uncharacterized membrane protein YhaH (DUF805 family)
MGVARRGGRKLQSRTERRAFQGHLAYWVALVLGVIVYIKRFHDRDKSGWWVLIGLIPIIGAIWLPIELGFLKGTPRPNRFGPPVTD